MATDAVLLVVVGNGDREVRSVREVGAVRREAGLSEADLAVEGEPHVGPSEIGEEVAQLAGQSLRRVVEPVVARDRRQVLVEADDGRAITLLGTPQCHPPSVRGDVKMTDH